MGGRANDVISYRGSAVSRLGVGLLSNRIGANFTKFDSLFSNRTYTKVRFAANRTIFVEYSQFDELS